MALTMKTAKPSQGMQLEQPGKRLPFCIMAAGLFQAPRGVVKHVCVTPLIYTPAKVAEQRRA